MSNSENIPFSITIIIGEAPYGSERSFTALRFTLAALLEELQVNIFLIEDGVFLGINNQDPSDFPNNGNFLKQAIEAGAMVIACGPCCRSRGLAEIPLIEGIKRGTIMDLVDFVKTSDRTIFF